MYIKIYFVKQSCILVQTVFKYLINSDDKYLIFILDNFVNSCIQKCIFQKNLNDDAVFKIKSHISVFFKKILKVKGLLKIGIILKKNH